MAKRGIIDKPLTSEEFKDLYKASTDPFHFATGVHVINPVSGKTRFDLYPYQIAVLWAFLKNRFNIVLKFRQAGLTELISMLCLWLAMYHANKNIVIISIKEPVAKKVLRKIKYMYKNLPDHWKVPIINGRKGEYGTSCITRDTIIVGKDRDFAIGDICPLNKGILDVSEKNIKVLTHNGTFEKITKTINKGKLETWEIQDDKGNILKCTPNHRLYTIKGWKKIRDIIASDIPIITWNTSYLDSLDIPKTIPTKKEIIKDTKYQGYFVSNTGKVFSNKSGKLRRMQTRVMGHERIKLRLGHGEQVFTSVHKLVWETFSGPIPEGHVVDHVDCDRYNNDLNNLQCITFSQNTKRAYKINRSLINNNYRPTKLPLRKIGILKNWLKQKHYYGLYKKLAKKTIGEVNSKWVSQLANGQYLSHIETSKIKVVRKFITTIVDMEVENDHSYISKSGFINHNTEMEFSNGSLITSVPTTEEAGRSEAVSLLVIDEAAIVRWAEQIWASAFPTLSTGGRAILNSTPYGVGNFFHKQWVDACNRDSPFVPIRLKWEMHPERDINWYNEMARALGPRRTAQEIDGDFLQSGHTVFNLDDIRAIEDMLDEWPPLDWQNHPKLKQFKKYRDSLVLLSEPQKNLRYGIGADVGSGRSLDSSAFAIHDQHGEEHGFFKGKLSPTELANLLGELGSIYNKALLAPESNDIGLATAEKLQNDGYPNLYYSQKILRKKNKPKPEVSDIPGWYTTKSNRPVIISELEEAIRMGEITIKNPFFVREAYTFIYDNQNKPIAMGKRNLRAGQEDSLSDGDETYSDDAILSEAITNRIRKSAKSNISIMPV